MTAEQFKRLWKASGLSQDEFGKLLGLSIRTVNGYCTGNMPIPKRTERLIKYILGDQSESK